MSWYFKMNQFPSTCDASAVFTWRDAVRCLEFRKKILNDIIRSHNDSSGGRCVKDWEMSCESECLSKVDPNGMSDFRRSEVQEAIDDFASTCDSSEQRDEVGCLESSKQIPIRLHNDSRGGGCDKDWEMISLSQMFDETIDDFV